MSDAVNQVEQPVTIDAAAKHFGMDRIRARKRAIETGIALDWGGTEKRKFIRVFLSEFRDAVVATRYVPAKKKKTDEKPKPKRIPTRLHPDVAC